MKVDFALPVVLPPTATVSQYWFRYMFAGSPSESPQINALANTYMRMVEAAVVEYNLASAALREVWADPMSIGLRAMHRSISHFESCVSDIHRAIASYSRLRNHRAMDALTLYLAEVKPRFISSRISDRIREIRNAVHHSEEMVLAPEFPEGQSIALKPDGDVVPHPTEEGMTLKIYSRLEIGPLVLPFSLIADCLNELSEVAAKVAQFDPREQPTSTAR